MITKEAVDELGLKEGDKAPTSLHPNEFGCIRQWNYNILLLFNVFHFNIDINSPTYI
jgi:hypothetical protein